MTRTELEALDRDELLARAEAAGVTRARILTRAELVDELLLRSAADQETKQRARGFFGRARDLLARVVEQGLNLPDAADRIRAFGVAPPPRGSAPSALPTVTLAEIYAAQGHRDRAIETLENVLAREPDHATANALLAQLRDASFPVPEPRLPPEPEEVSPPPATPREPMGMLDDAPLPTRYDVDECVAIPVDPTTLYAYWEVRDETLARASAAHTAGAVTLRVLVVVPTWDGPRSTLHDHEVKAQLGEWFVRDLPAGCIVRAPSPLLADTIVRWTPRGTFPVSPDDGDAASIERALGRVRRESDRAHREALLSGAPLGSSEQWMRVM
jgi:hypothetical protein